jgi:hypothetical protein
MDGAAPKQRFQGVSQLLQQWILGVGRMLNTSLFLWFVSMALIVPDESFLPSLSPSAVRAVPALWQIVKKLIRQPNDFLRKDEPEA